MTHGKITIIHLLKEKVVNAEVRLVLMEKRQGAWWAGRNGSHLLFNSKRDREQTMYKIKRTASEAKGDTTENNDHTTPPGTTTTTWLHHLLGPSEEHKVWIPSRINLRGKRDQGSQSCLP